MRKRFFTLGSLFLLAALYSPRMGAGSEADSGGPELHPCFVMLIDEAEVPAQEAGALAEIKVKEGSTVKGGQLIARLDDRRAVIEKRLAEFEYEAAREKGENDVNTRYAKAAADVAEAEYQSSLEANRKVPGSVSDTEIRRLKLDHRRAALQIEQAVLEQTVAKSTAQAAAAKVNGADDSIRRRQISSPTDGVIVEVKKHVGEWVQPGDVVAHVVRLDRLRVEGFVKAAKYPPAQIQDHEVTVRAELAGGQPREFKGRIVFVSPLEQSGGVYRVKAEVDNVKEAGQWLLQPGGNPVTMKVH